jgi:hypothetical protein
VTLVYGVDSSFDLLSPQEARRLVDAGVRVFAQCLWTGEQAPSVRVESLRNAQAVGLILIGYIAVSPGRIGRQHVDIARDGIPDDLWAALVKTPIDVELEGLNYQTHVIQAHDRAAELGKAWDTYTSYYFWENVLHFPARRPGTGLWNALWDLNPDIDFPSLRYGSWQDHEVWGEQWSGGADVGGQWADQNTFVLEALQTGAPSPPPPAPQPPSPRPPRLRWAIPAVN